MNWSPFLIKHTALWQSCFLGRFPCPQVITLETLIHDKLWLFFHGSKHEKMNKNFIKLSISIKHSKIELTAKGLPVQFLKRKKYIGYDNSTKVKSFLLVKKYLPIHRFPKLLIECKWGLPSKYLVSIFLSRI